MNKFTQYAEYLSKPLFSDFYVGAVDASYRKCFCCFVRDLTRLCDLLRNTLNLQRNYISLLIIIQNRALLMFVAFRNGSVFF